MQQLKLENKYLKNNIPDVRVGNTVRVHQKIKEGTKERIQIFEGVVIAVKHGKGLDGSFSVRKISAGVGVEKTFPLHLPTIVKVERIKSAKVHQAKIYYLRDRKGRAARLSGERRNLETWEEAGTQKEIEAIKEEQAEVAQQKAEQAEEEKTEELASSDNEQAQQPTAGQDGGDTGEKAA